MSEIAEKYARKIRRMAQEASTLWGGVTFTDAFEESVKLEVERAIEESRGQPNRLNQILEEASERVAKWPEWKKSAEVRESSPSLDHLAFSIAHGTFNSDSPGGCSCALCTTLREKIKTLQCEEAAKFYEEHYPPPSSAPPLKCVWCGVSSKTRDGACCAPDGDGHLFTAGAAQEVKQVHNGK